MADDVTAPRRGRRLLYLLLVIPFIALLYPPFYAAAKPAFAGIPFFYWYQFLWILISAVITAAVYLADRQTTG